MTWIIRNWDKFYEKEQRKARLKKAHWVAVSNKHDGKSFRRLMRLPDGLEIYGAWILILSVASKCPKRGILADDDGDLTSADISDKTGAPESSVSKALQALSDKAIGWIEQTNITTKMYTLCALPAHDMTEIAATGQDRTVQTDKQIPASPLRSKTIDGEVFVYLTENQKLTKSDAAKAKAMLAKGASWSPHTLGCLLYALASEPPANDPIAYAKGCASGKSGSRRDVENQIMRAGALLKSFQRRVDDEKAYEGIPT